jgi:hypothetical protein
MCALTLFPAALLGRRFGGFRRLAALGFAVVATLANFVCAFLCVYMIDMGGRLLMFLGWYFSFPLILGFGAAWACCATRPEAVPRRSPLLAWALVLMVAILPLTMALGQWPFRLAFLASKPALDRLADQVVVGQASRGPVRAGLFRIVRSSIDSSSGNVGLIINPDPSGRGGFVRYRLDPSTPRGRRNGPFYNLNFELQLCDRWRYECED